MQFFCFCYVFLFYSSTVSCSAGSCVSSLIEAGVIEFFPSTLFPPSFAFIVIVMFPASIPPVFLLTKASAGTVTVHVFCPSVVAALGVPENVIVADFYFFLLQ